MPQNLVQDQLAFDIHAATDAFLSSMAQFQPTSSHVRKSRMLQAQGCP